MSYKPTYDEWMDALTTFVEAIRSHERGREEYGFRELYHLIFIGPPDSDEIERVLLQEVKQMNIAEKWPDRIHWFRKFSGTREQLRDLLKEYPHRDLSQAFTQDELIDLLIKKIEEEPS